MERMFRALDTNLIMDVVTHVVQEFDVCFTFSALFRINIGETFSDGR
jgi:hypothetical protein